MISSTSCAATTTGSVGPPSTAPCSGWSRPASRARSILARDDSGSSTPIAIRGTSTSSARPATRSAEFLSSDIEGLIEEIATARGFTPRQSVVQIYGTCDECRTGRRPADDKVTTELLFARDALRIAIATETQRAGILPARLATDQGCSRAPGIPEAGRRGKRTSRHAPGALRRAARTGSVARVAADVPVLQGRRRRALRRRRGRAGPRRGRQGGAQDRHSLRTGVAPVLQALR